MPPCHRTLLRLVNAPWKQTGARRLVLHHSKWGKLTRIGWERGNTGEEGMGGFNKAPYGVIVALSAFVVAMCTSAPTVQAEQIIFIGPGAPVMQGTTFSVNMLIRNNTTNLVGYSLDVDVAPLAGAVGSVTGNAALSNFSLTSNLIERDPTDSLHPIFSVIAPAVDGGVFFNGQSLSGTPVNLALPGFSDGLGQVFFDVPMGASGLFEISLGPGTSLFDGVNPVPFVANVFNVQVVPEPGSLGILGGFWLLLRCRRSARRSRRKK